MLAHELTHVVQQSPALRARPAHPVSIGAAPVQIQRDPEDDAPGVTDVVFHPLQSLRKVSAKIPGYKLFTVIIAYDPIQGTQVDRNADSLVGEFLKLIGATETYKNLIKSKALDNAFNWLNGEIANLGFSVQMFKDLATEAVKIAASEIVHGIDAMLKALYVLFDPPLQRAKTFAVDVLKKVGAFIFNGALELIGGTGLLDILHEAGDAISAVIKDPVGFVGHLVDALKRGFGQFSAKIVDYLKEGVLKWLFGALGNIQIPKQITIGSVFNLVLDVLGLTYRKIRPQLVEAFGGERPLKIVEKGFELLEIIVREGFGAAWKEVVKQAGDLLKSFLSAAKDWAITKVVQAAVVELVKLFNPAGAVIAAIQAIYTTLKVFIEKAKQIAALVKAIVDSISRIAAGQIEQAANFIEGVMAGSIPLMIGFLADFLGLGDVAAKVREIIQSVRDKIKLGIKKVIDYIVQMGKGLLAKGRDAVASVVEWWKQKRPFKLGEEEHDLYLDGDGDHPQVMVESSLTTLELFLENVGASAKDKTRILGLAAKVKWRKGEVQDSSKGADDGQANLDALIESIKALNVKGVKLPESDIQTPKPVNKYGGATGIKAFLSLNHCKGTTPNKSNDPAIWNDLGSIRKEKSYVRGHLLNDRLGGLGEWDNMMPLTNKANGDYFRAMEKDLIEAVSTGKQLAWIEVDATYNNKTIPANGKTREKEEAAESRLGELRWKYGPAIFEGDSWKKSKVKSDPKQVKENSGFVTASEG